MSAAPTDSAASWAQARKQLHECDANTQELSGMVNDAKNKLAASKADLNKLLAEKSEVEGQVAVVEGKVQAAKEAEARHAKAAAASDSLAASLAEQLRMQVDATATARAAAAKQRAELEGTLGAQRARLERYRQSVTMLPL